MNSQTVSPEPPPTLYNFGFNPYTRWVKSFEQRDVHQSYRTSFITNSMILAQIAGVILIIFNAFTIWKTIPVVIGLTAAAVVQYFYLFHVQRRDLSTGSSGRRVGLIIAAYIMVWAIMFALMGDNLILQLGTSVVLLLVFSIIALNTRVWFFEIALGDVILTHAPNRPEKQISIRGRTPPRIPDDLIPLFNERGLYNTIYEYLDYDMPEDLNYSLQTLWIKAFSAAPAALERVCQVLKITPTTNAAHAQIVLDAFLTQMRQLRSDPVIWLRPGEPYYIIWNQNEPVAVTTVVEKIATAEMLQVDLQVNLYAFVDPEKITSPMQRIMMAQSPSRETISNLVEFMVRDRIRQAAQYYYNHRAYLEAYSPQGLEQFRAIIASNNHGIPNVPQLLDLESLCGANIWEETVDVQPLMPEKIRDVLERKAVAHLEANIDLAKMREYLMELEKLHLDPEVEKLLRLQIIAINAVDESRVKGGKRAARGVGPRLVIPDMTKPTPQKPDSLPGDIPKPAAPKSAPTNQVNTPPAPAATPPPAPASPPPSPPPKTIEMKQDKDGVYRSRPKRNEEPPI